MLGVDMFGWWATFGAGKVCIKMFPLGGLVARGTCVCNDGLGMLSSKLVLLWLTVVGLGLLLLKLPMGLATPLLLPVLPANNPVAGATTLILSSSREPCGEARIAAALSRTEGTLWSSCSVVLERGVRCGLGGRCGYGGEGEVMGSMSRSKIADEDECLVSKL